MLTTEQAQLLYRARMLIQAMQKHPPGSPARLLLDNFLPKGMDYELSDLLLDLERKSRLPVVFSLDVPGFVWVGLVGEQFAVTDPGLLGLSAAWEIFFHGENAQFVLFAARYGTSPNSLRNAMEPAAEWADCHCRRLGAAIRAIKVYRDGSARFIPTAPTPIILHGPDVFSACFRPPPAG